MKTWTHPDRATEHRLATPGPWDNEPDKAQWIDEATDLDCLAVRNHFGTWCGYVGLPPGHPLHGSGYLDVDVEDVEVHGGLTFASACDEEAVEGHGICHVPEPGRPADVWWLGFDCGHAFDVTPSAPEHLPFPGATYKRLEYVRAECVHLAAQLHEAAAGER